MTILWSFVGALRGNPEQAIVESIRVYFVFMWIYCFLIICISNSDYSRYVDTFFCVAALGISIICFYVLFDYIFHLDWLSASIKKEMFLEAGIHVGYVQMNNVNIGMFCFIIPFLLSRIIVESRPVNYKIVLVLLLSVMSVILASRRIILFLLFITPILTYAIGIMTSGNHMYSVRKIVGFYMFALLMSAIALFALFIHNPQSLYGFISRILDIFVQDPQSVRQLQNKALIYGFQAYPIFGSGFGGLTEVIRSTERPWNYELTYSKLLFNSGIIGASSLLAFYSFYFVMVIKKIRGSRLKEIYIPLFVGFICVLIASATNPYLSSFDFIFVLSIIPLILNTKEGLGVNQNCQS